MRHHAIHLLAVLLLAGCSGSDHSPTKPASWTPGTCADFAVVTTNYQTGRIREVGVDSGTIAMRADSQAVNSDAVARVYGGLIYVVNRFGADNVQVVDPAHGFTTIRQFSVGIGSNPHDIVVTAADRAYVSRYGRASVLGLDPRSGAVRDSISLASLADADGIPDMDRMFYAAPYLYVALERISFTPPNYPPVPPSYLAIIDTRADTLAGAITLQGLNPSERMVWDAAHSVLLVPETGVIGVLDGGVEKVDLAARRSAGWLVREQDLGGDLINFAVAAGNHGYATISLPGGSGTALVAFDAATGAKGATIYTSSSYDLLDLAVAPCGALLVADHNYTHPGLRIYDAATGRPWSSPAQPVSTGLPPFELTQIDPAGP